MNLNWTKKTVTYAVVEITYRFDFMTEPKTEISDSYRCTALEDTEATVRKAYDGCISAFTFHGTYDQVWFEAETSHGVADNMGRELGHWARVTHVRRGWEVRMQTTRANKSYGALSRTTTCETLVEAFVLADEKAAKGKKAAAKAALKGGRKS